MSEQVSRRTSRQPHGSTETTKTLQTRFTDSGRYLRLAVSRPAVAGSKDRWESGPVGHATTTHTTTTKKQFI